MARLTPFGHLTINLDGRYQTIRRPRRRPPAATNRLTQDPAPILVTGPQRRSGAEHLRIDHRGGNYKWNGSPNPGWTVQPNAAEPEAPVVSVAVTVTGKVPAALGVPVIRPVAGLIASPGGSPVAV